MSKKCPKCGSIRIVESPSGDVSICLACESFLNTIIGKSKPTTLFDRITASPEVLADKLVYQTEDEFGDVTWSSTIIPGWYVGREDCIAATVEKLKEVEK